MKEETITAIDLAKKHDAEVIKKLRAIKLNTF
jgi:hypothetical protein